MFGQKKSKKDEEKSSGKKSKSKRDNVEAAANVAAAAENGTDSSHLTLPSQLLPSSKQRHRSSSGSGGSRERTDNVTTTDISDTSDVRGHQTGSTTSRPSSSDSLQPKKKSRHRDTVDSGFSSKEDSCHDLTLSAHNLHQAAAAAATANRGGHVSNNSRDDQAAASFQRSANRASMKKAYGVYEPMASYAGAKGSLTRQHAKSMSVPASAVAVQRENTMTRSDEHLSVLGARGGSNNDISVLQPISSDVSPKKSKKSSKKDGSGEKPKKSKKHVESVEVNNENIETFAENYNEDPVKTAKLKRSASDHQKPPKAKHKEKSVKAAEGDMAMTSGSLSVLPPANNSSLSPQLSFSGVSGSSSKQQMSPSLSFSLYRRPSSISDSYNFISVNALCPRNSDPNSAISSPMNDENATPLIPLSSSPMRKYNASGWEQRRPSEATVTVSPIKSPQQQSQVSLTPIVESLSPSQKSSSLDRRQGNNVNSPSPPPPPLPPRQYQSDAIITTSPPEQPAIAAQFADHQHHLWVNDSLSGGMNRRHSAMETDKPMEFVNAQQLSNSSASKPPVYQQDSNNRSDGYTDQLRKESSKRYSEGVKVARRPKVSSTMFAGAVTSHGEPSLSNRRSLGRDVAAEYDSNGVSPVYSPSVDSYAPRKEPLQNVRADSMSELQTHYSYPNFDGEHKPLSANVLNRSLPTAHPMPAYVESPPLRAEPLQGFSVFAYGRDNVSYITTPPGNVNTDSTTAQNFRNFPSPGMSVTNPVTVQQYQYDGGYLYGQQQQQLQTPETTPVFEMTSPYKSDVVSKVNTTSRGDSIQYNHGNDLYVSETYGSNRQVPVSHRDAENTRYADDSYTNVTYRDTPLGRHSSVTRHSVADVSPTDTRNEYNRNFSTLQPDPSLPDKYRQVGSSANVPHLHATSVQYLGPALSLSDFTADNQPNFSQQLPLASEPKFSQPSSFYNDVPTQNFASTSNAKYQLGARSNSINDVRNNSSNATSPVQATVSPSTYRSTLTLSLAHSNDSLANNTARVSPPDNAKTKRPLPSSYLPPWTSNSARRSIPAAVILGTRRNPEEQLLREDSVTVPQSNGNLYGDRTVTEQRSQPPSSTTESIGNSDKRSSKNITNSDRTSSSRSDSFSVNNRQRSAGSGVLMSDRYLKHDQSPPQTIAKVAIGMDNMYPVTNSARAAPVAVESKIVSTPLSNEIFVSSHKEVKIGATAYQAASVSPSTVSQENANTIKNVLQPIKFDDDHLMADDENNVSLEREYLKCSRTYSTEPVTTSEKRNIFKTRSKTAEEPKRVHFDLSPSSSATSKSVRDLSSAPVVVEDRLHSFTDIPAPREDISGTVTFDQTNAYNTSLIASPVTETSPIRAIATVSGVPAATHLRAGTADQLSANENDSEATIKMPLMPLNELAFEVEKNLLITYDALPKDAVDKSSGISEDQTEADVTLSNGDSKPVDQQTRPRVQKSPKPVVQQNIPSVNGVVNNGDKQEKEQACDDTVRSCDKEIMLKYVQKKLDQLVYQKQTLELQIKENDALGEQVEEILQKKLSSKDVDKYQSYIADLKMVTKLLVNLSTRIAQHKSTMSPQSPDDKKRGDKLNEQLEDAENLKVGIERRGKLAMQTARAMLTSEETDNFERYVNTLPMLLTRQAELEEKLRQGTHERDTLNRAVVTVSDVSDNEASC